MGAEKDFFLIERWFRHEAYLDDLHELALCLHAVVVVVNDVRRHGLLERAFRLGLFWLEVGCHGIA